MFYHVKDLQFNARVSRPDPAFATLLLEQFGGANGELAAALRYFGQAFGAKKPYPDKYDLLMDIATEEFSHLEIVGATIQMLLTGINGDLKKAAEESEIMQLLDGKAAKENMIHQGMVAPQFFVGSGGTPAYTNSQGVPWTAAYINGDIQGELTSDLRSNIGAETKAKIVYEYLLQFTDDPYVKETLRFLMTREVAHYQMFEAALATIQPNFPAGTLQGDPRYSNLYFNMSTGNDFTGPWNSGTTTQTNETVQFIEDPISYIMETNGLLKQKATGAGMTEQEAKTFDEKLGKKKSEEVKMAAPIGAQQWNDPEAEAKIAKKITARNAVPVPGEDASVTAMEAPIKSFKYTYGIMEEKVNSSKGVQLQAGSIDITYYTDPLCCWSWAFEPEWRKLQFEFEGLLTWNYRMGGLLPSWNNYTDTHNSVSRPLQMGPVWMHASHLSGMYMENSIWMKDPPESSYPACIAVKCAQLQSPEYAERYLRLLREAVMLRGINIAKYDELVKLADILANQSNDFDVEIFQQHLSGKEGLESFKTDMQQIRNYNITRFPTLIFRVLNRPSVLMTGYRPYNALLQVLQQIAPDIKAVRKVNSENEYKSYWRTITTREVEEALK